MSKLTNMTRPHRGVEALIFTTKETGSPVDSPTVPNIC